MNPDSKRPPQLRPKTRSVVARAVGGRLDRPAAGSRLWLLDPRIAYLNHGSFGACPRAVLQFQGRIRSRLEGQPVQFFVRDLERLLDSAREALAAFLDADPDGLVFVQNATAGVNTVLRSLRFRRGDGCCGSRLSSITRFRSINTWRER